MKLESDQEREEEILSKGKREGNDMKYTERLLR